MAKTKDELKNEMKDRLKASSTHKVNIYDAQFLANFANNLESLLQEATDLAANDAAAEAFVDSVEAAYVAYMSNF